MTTLDPVVSSPAGGGQITVDGSGFGPAGTPDSILFCPSAARQVSCVKADDVVVVSDSEITAKIPEESLFIKETKGEAGIAVEVPPGVSNAPDFALFTYKVVIDALNPVASAPAGGGQITISGSGFGPAGTPDSVLFCPSAARQVSCVKADDVVVDNDALITAKIPPESSYIKATHGAAGVIVAVPPGVSNAPNFVAFNYG